MPAALMIAIAIAHSVPIEETLDNDATAMIFATIGRSEFCPAGNVQLDLSSGRYVLTPPASQAVCGKAKLERPVIRANLDRDQLVALRAAFARAERDGLSIAACRYRIPPELIVINNGGTPILVLTDGAGTTAAPDEEGCWNNAAKDLYEKLDRIFSPDDYR